MAQSLGILQASPTQEDRDCSLELVSLRKVLPFHCRSACCLWGEEWRKRKGFAHELPSLQNQ